MDREEADHPQDPGRCRDGRESRQIDEPESVGVSGDPPAQRRRDCSSRMAKEKSRELSARRPQGAQKSSGNGHADDPPCARLRFPAQGFLDEALAARHLVEGLLVRRDAPYLVVGQRRSVVARRFLQRIEPIHFALEAYRIAGGAVIGVAFASA